jgi:acyl-CoA thioesterase
MPLDPALEPLIRERFRSSEFARWMGISLVSLDVGESELRLDLEKHHLNPGGIVHGGVLATLLDASIGLALRSKIGMTTDHVTIELDVHYLSPARTGALIGRGHAVRVGGRVSYGEADVFSDDGKVLAKGTATFLVVQARRPGSVPLGGDA